MPGGTSFYFSSAIHNMPVSYHLVTSLALADNSYVKGLKDLGIEMTVFPSAHTLFFENIYQSNQDHRKQKVLKMADPFHPDQIMNVGARIFHLGPLLADDIPLTLIKSLSLKAMVSLDVQGFLREVRGVSVHSKDWDSKKEVLPFIEILKANESEMEMLTGQQNVLTGARILSEWGVKEVVITLGSRGSVIYRDNQYYSIPAFSPESIVDATGCGDTYMAGYLYQRIKDVPIRQAGEFAAAMATLKIQASGPFFGSEADVLLLANNADKVISENR